MALASKATKEDQAREDRITMEVVVDAHDSDERAMGWYHYLYDKLKVPFAARCKSARPVSPLATGEMVQVLGMAPAEECEAEMLVWVQWKGRKIAVPLMELQPKSDDDETQEAVGDWHYWLARGYEF